MRAGGGRCAHCAWRRAHGVLRGGDDDVQIAPRQAQATSARAKELNCAVLERFLQHSSQPLHEVRLRAPAGQGALVDNAYWLLFLNFQSFSLFLVTITIGIVIVGINATLSIL